MKKTAAILALVAAYAMLPWLTQPVLAADSSIHPAVQTTVSTLAVISSVIATFLLVYAGYLYMTSAGNPEAVNRAKLTIQRALIGLVIVWGAFTATDLLRDAAKQPDTATEFTEARKYTAEDYDPCLSQSEESVFSLIFNSGSNKSGGLGCTLSVAYSSFLKSMIASAIQPLSQGIQSFLVSTDYVSTNSVIRGYWQTNLVVATALFTVVIALIGLQFMSSSVLGFEEIQLRQILPRLSFAYIGALSSIFIIDGLIWFSNSLTRSLTEGGGTLADAFIGMIFDYKTFATQSFGMVTLFFMLVFILLTAILLLLYISRAITIAVAAVLSPFIFLLWVTPKTRAFAESAISRFLIILVMPVVHVVMVQLAAGFLNTTKQWGTNPFLSVIMSIGIIISLLKTPSLMAQLMSQLSQNNTYKRTMSQLMNVLSAKSSAPSLPRSTRRPSARKK